MPKEPSSKNSAKKNSASGSASKDAVRNALKLQLDRGSAKLKPVTNPAAEYLGHFLFVAMSPETPFNELVSRVRGGDSAAAEEIVRRYESAIRIVVRTRLSDPALRRQFDSMDEPESGYDSRGPVF